MQYGNIREEEIKNKVTVDFFGNFDCTEVIRNIDFAVKLKRPANAIDFHDEYLLWAEAKQKKTDIVAMLAQLVLTIGKARTFDKIVPPKFLGCFDSEKIAFVPYHDIQDIFYQNDFNWNVVPSNHETREFKQVYEKIKNVIENDIPFETYLFNFEKDEKELKRFIRENFIVDKSETTKIRIDKNNFINIYNKWFETVKPTIQVDNWDLAKKHGIIDGDFYLADLLSVENKTLKEKLFVLLKSDHYELDRKIDETGLKNFKTTAFSDNQKAHTQFWAKYERPPIEDYWDYIVDHRHLLVPQDIRERKGSFYTPRIWVEKSQEYLAKVFGEDWQKEYYIWDCAAGTGNLLAGLTNKYNIWASTLDKADVDVIHDRIDNGANLLRAHVFQFDFLNDDFSKLPDGLQKIINDPKKRQKLIIYINPPYAEATNYNGNIKSNVAKNNKIFQKYTKELNGAMNELFAQFFIRINKEIPDSKLAAFSKLKYVSAPNYKDFRKHFNVAFLNGFVCPSSAFDNVKGNFPISFSIFDLEIKKELQRISCDIYDKNAHFIDKKTFLSNSNSLYINNWITKFQNKKMENIGYLNCANNSFQNQKYVWISCNEQNTHCTHLVINVQNLIPVCVYFTVRKVIPATWLNDRDQFLYPNDGWKNDIEFQNDCLAYTLFNNNISAKHGVNHWIPFAETEVDAKEKYENHFMIDYLSKPQFSQVTFTAKNLASLFEPGFYQDIQNTQDLFLYKNNNQDNHNNQAKIKVQTKVQTKEQTDEQPKREFSPEAQAVFDAGRELWRYYHAQKNVNINASLYDIREYFQGRNDKGKMNSKSDDEKYNELIGALRESLYILAKKIEPKVYEYGFLLR